MFVCLSLLCQAVQELIKVLFHVNMHPYINLSNLYIVLSQFSVVISTTTV
jgi:hypothetical protein